MKVLECLFQLENNDLPLDVVCKYVLFKNFVALVAVKEMVVVARIVVSF